MNREQYLLDYDTTPVINLIRDQIVRQDFLERYLSLYDHLPLANTKKPHTVLDHIKYRLGRQDFCWTGSHKYWIWEFGEGRELIRLFVNNTKGLCFEVSVDANLDTILPAVYNIFDRITSNAEQTSRTNT